MAPKLRAGDRIIGYPVKLTSKIKRGDIVIFNVPFSSHYHIKRVIGMPNEKVMINRGKIFINDRLLVGAKTIQTDFSNYKKEVSSGCYFLLGDNMRESQDSRNFGAIPLENILYKALMIYHPLKRFAFLERINHLKFWYNVFKSCISAKADKI